MRKGVQVYSCDSNPGIDAPAYHVTRTEADTRIEKGFAVWLTPTSIQTRPPGWTEDEEKCIAGGVIRQAWRQKWSDGYIVLQMVARDEDDTNLV
jgi:hypothetical protein